MVLFVDHGLAFAEFFAAIRGASQVRIPCRLKSNFHQFLSTTNHHFLWIVKHGSYSQCAGYSLALNFYYRPEPPKPAPVDSGESSAVSESTTSPLSSQETSAPKDGVEIKGNGLVTQAPVEAIGENIETLTTHNAEGQPEVEFAITSHGGGIKTATMLNQLAVGATSKKVILNEHSPAPIGSICHSPDGYLNLYYDLVKEGDAIFCQATTPDGVQITKKWALVQNDQKPGSPWSINLTITMTNQGKGKVILPNFSLFAGSASPLHPDEWENQGGAYYLNNGSLTNKDSSWFKKGFFRNARQLFSESVEELEYAGVSNQFFTTLIRPSGKYAATVWAKASEVRIPGDNPDRPKYAVRSGFTFPDVEVDPGELANFSYSALCRPQSIWCSEENGNGHLRGDELRVVHTDQRITQQRSQLAAQHCFL